VKVDFCLIVARIRLIAAYKVAAPVVVKDILVDQAKSPPKPRMILTEARVVKHKPSFRTA
jgi:hypothetical protein